MIEMSQLTVLVMVEVILGLAILCGVLGYFALTRKGKVRRAAQHLAERVQSDKPARSERLKSLLSDQYGLSGAELDQTLHNITQAEMRLFQNLINGFMKDDQIHLQQVDVDEENLVLAYQTLKPAQGGGERSAAPTGEGGDVEEMQRLQDENERLSDELRVTMDTMGRMLNEYSSMFSGGFETPLTREGAAAAPGAGAGDEIEVDIPDLTTDDVAVEPMPPDPDDLLDDNAEASSTLDEEVSEIIDEVMEIADEMNQDSEQAPATEAQTPDLGESLLDELEQVDIELPETPTTDESVSESESQSEPEPESEPKPEPESEQASLEEEWAKLLEDDAADKEKPNEK